MRCSFDFPQEIFLGYDPVRDVEELVLHFLEFERIPTTALPSVAIDVDENG